MQRNITLLKKAWTGIQSITAKITGTDTDAVYVETSDANATASKIQAGATAYVNGSKITGAMPNATMDEFAVSIVKNTSTHTATCTPYVLNETDGFLAADEYVGTAGTVSASELVSGSQTITSNGTYDVTNLAELVVSVSGTTVKTATGTFTGNGTRTIDVSCDFEPDIVYFTSSPGTTASSGTVAAIIVRGMMAATRYRNNSTSNSHYAIPGIVDMNTSGSSYSWRATYANSKVTLYCFSNNARALLTNGRTYSYTFTKYTS